MHPLASSPSAAIIPPISAVADRTQIVPFPLPVRATLLPPSPSPLPAVLPAPGVSSPPVRRALRHAPAEHSAEPRESPTGTPRTPGSFFRSNHNETPTGRIPAGFPSSRDSAGSSAAAAETPRGGVAIATAPTRDRETPAG